MGRPPADSTPTVNERSGRGDAAADADEPAGAATVPGPRYALGEEIARGGMGRVVEATDTLLGRVVALKEALSDDREALRRFARETRITARLEHPSIVPVHDAGTTPEGSPFYVMRKVSGRPLEDLVGEADALATRLALLPHVLAAAQAIAHAHERGVLHRDLKPSNILVGSLGETVVIDWGLAKVIDEPDDPDEPAVVPVSSAGDSLRTRVGTVFGTPGFMSPEQLRGETVDARSDVYALGATLYYVLAQRPPHAAKTGDAMMIAALAGPPQQIAEVAPGVPAELTTIVDKALAYEASARYAHAGAFVEDLQRFLTGQLVASHRYSRRERLRRFLRRHKLPVAISVVAAAAIAVVASLAIRRVITERNRADLALAQALDRNEQLLVTQAQTLLATNPTAAVATIKPLAATRWRDARAIGMAARAAGTVRGYPASQHTSMLTLTRDGEHALSVGTDGLVRRYDLVHHTTQELLRVGVDRGTYLVDDDRSLISWGDDHVEVIDLATGSRRAIALHGTLYDLRARDTRMWMVTETGEVFAQGLEEPQPRKIEIAGKMDRTDPAPIGPWVAYVGDGLWLQRADDPPIKLVTGNVSFVDWADDGLRIGATVGRRVFEITIVDGVPTVTQDKQGRAPISIASVRSALYTGGFGMIHKTTASQPDGFDVRVVDGAIQRLVHAYRGSLLAVSSIGMITLLGEQVTLTLIPPASNLHLITAASSSRYVVASTDGALVVWDLAPMLPELLPLERPPAFTVVGTHQLVALYVDKPAEWIELETREVAKVDVGIDPVFVTGSAHGNLISVTRSSGATRIFRRGDPDPIPLDAQFSMGYFTYDDHLLVASITGEILTCAPPGFRPRSLFKHASQPVSLASHSSTGGWTSALYEDGTIWRYDDRTQRNESISTSAHIGWSFIVAGGDVFFSDGRLVKRWRADGSVVVHATLPRAISRGYLVDPVHVLVLTEDDAGYDLRLDLPDSVASRFAPGSRLGSLAIGSDIALTVDNSGAILATDPVTAVRWTFARTNRSAFTLAMMADDGSRVFSLADDGILMWSSELPRTPEDTVRFLDSLTNARAPTGPAALTWE